MEEYKLALDYCGKAIAQKSDFPEVYNNRGNIYYMLSKDSEAIVDYSKAIEFNPNYAGAYFNRGTTYFYLKNDYENAKKDWILILDQDEQITPELEKEIVTVINSDSKQNGYWIPRKNIIF